MNKEKNYFILICLLAMAMQSGCSQNRNIKVKSDFVRHDSQPEKETVYFDFNQSQVKDSEKDKLNKVARWLIQDKKSMAILEGHTDQIGQASYNDILGEERSRSVRVYLRDQGADPRQMTVISKGKREPVVKNGKGQKALAPNRRVEVKMSLTNK